MGPIGVGGGRNKGARVEAAALCYVGCWLDRWIVEVVIK